LTVQAEVTGADHRAVVPSAVATALGAWSEIFTLRKADAGAAAFRRGSVRQAARVCARQTPTRSIGVPPRLGTALWSHPEHGPPQRQRVGEQQLTDHDPIGRPNAVPRE